MNDTAAIATGNSKIFHAIKMISYLRSAKEATVADISQNTEIPVATVYRTVHVLRENNFLLQKEKLLSSNGRQPTLYSLNSTYAFGLCIILEKTLISVCIINLEGRIIQQSQLDFKSNWKKDEVLEEIHRAIVVLQNEETDMKRCRIIHIAVEADVDIANGRILCFSGAACFDNFDIVKYFQERYGIRARLDKLLYVEAFASICNYCRYEFKNYVYLHIGVGFGAAIVIDQKIYAGANGKAGELVRLKTPDGRSWEEVYNTSQLYQRFIEAASKPSSRLNAIFMETLAPSRSGTVPALINVLDRALYENCDEAIQMVSAAADGWVDVIEHLQMFFDPEVVVIGGDISGDVPNVFEIIRSKLQERGDRGVVLPAQYQTSLLDAVAEGLMDELYHSIYDDIIASF